MMKKLQELLALAWRAVRRLFGRKEIQPSGGGGPGEEQK